MALPVETPVGSSYRLYYTGAIGVAGVGVQQSWSVTSLPAAVREDPSFVDDWRIFVVAVDPGISALSHEVAFVFDANGLPIEFVLTFTSDDVGNNIALEAWFIHSEVR